MSNQPLVETANSSYDGYFIGPEHDTDKYYGVLTYYEGDRALITVTTTGSGIPHLFGKLSQMMDSLVVDYGRGVQQLPPDGDTTIQY